MNPALILAAAVGWLAGSAVLSITGYNAVMFALGRRGFHPQSQASSSLPDVSVLIVAKRWQGALQTTLRAVDEAEYPPNKAKIVIALGGTAPSAARASTIHPLQVFGSAEAETKPVLLNRSIQYLTGEHVLLLDEDSKVEPDCLRRMIPLMDDKVAAVVGLPYPTNASLGYLQATLWLEADAWATVAKAKDRLGLFLPATGFFSLLRLSALTEAGKWDDTMLAEDTDISVRLFARGWKTRLSSARVGIEAPVSLKGLLIQRFRWYKGMFDVLAKDARGIWSLPFAMGFDVVMTLLAPLAPAGFVLLLALSPLWPTFLVPAVLVLAATHLVASWSASAKLPGRRLGVVLFSIPYALVQGTVALAALGAFALRIRVQWQRTPKADDTTLSNARDVVDAIGADTSNQP